MTQLKPSDLTFAYIVTVVAGREVNKSYMSDERALAAARGRCDVIRVILICGQIVEKAELDTFG